VVGEADLSRLGDRATTDQAGVADGVMRGAEGARCDQGAAVHQPHDAVHACRFDGFRQGQCRQDRRKTLCQHRLPGAWRTNHDDIVATAGGDLEGALDVLLSFDLAEVDIVAGLTCEDALQVDTYGRDLAIAAQELEGLGQIGDGNDIDAAHDGCFGAVCRR